jgi:hypothetical protein
VFNDKSYCDTFVKDNYDSFRRRQEWNEHIYTKTAEDLIAEQEDINQESESNIK